MAYYNITKDIIILINSKKKKIKLQNELLKIQNENELIKTDKNHIEKIAREEYFYIYPNEIIISLD